MILFCYTNLSSRSCDIQEEIKMFKKKIYNEIVINTKNAIHSPDSFQQFCISIQGQLPKLFDTIPNSELHYIK